MPGPKTFNVLDLKGAVKGSVQKPEAFEESVRPEIIRRAAIAEQTHEFQPQGHFILAGMQTSAKYYGAMGSYRSGRHMGIAIRPRQKLGGGRQGDVRRIPSAVKGKRAHPHMVEKTIVERINKKEYQKAVASAVAATAMKDYVQSSKELPVILSDELQAIKKTKDIVKLIETLGFGSYLENGKVHIKKGLRRTAHQKHYKKSVLFVVKADNGVLKAAGNIPGVDACKTDSLVVNLLAPGGKPGRLAIWSESAVKSLDDDIGKLNVE